MNGLERTALALLRGVNFPPATPQKRFVRQLVADQRLSARQAAWLYALVKRYRRQLL